MSVRALAAAAARGRCDDVLRKCADWLSIQRPGIR